MAVIKNQKTGMWEVRTYYKDWTGTRRQKTKRGFAKKSDALEWERAFKLKDELNINMKFADFVELYLSDIQPRIKYNSYLTKKHIIETKILPYFGHRKLNEIRPADVIQWQNEIMKLRSAETFLLPSSLVECSLQMIGSMVLTSVRRTYKIIWFTL